MARTDQTRGQQHYKDAPASEADWEKDSAGRGSLSGNPKRGIITLRPPAQELQPKADRPAPPAEKTERPAPAEEDDKRDPQERSANQAARKGWLPRHPILAPVGVAALMIAAAAGYLYWDHTSHLESTDDAFVAARQFAIAPKVPGYVTAVPVTDNQHVDKGDVIAQIDQRDYRVALAQAEAQVAGAQAGIHNIDAQIDAQGAQSRQPKLR